MTYEILPLVERVQIPRKLAALDIFLFGLTCKTKDGTTVQTVDREFGSSLDVAIGFAKHLQGIITNFFHRAAKAACILVYSKDLTYTQRADLLKALNLSETLLLKCSVKQVNCYIHQYMSDAGEACMTEVLMDRRKYVKGDPDRFDKALKNMSQVIMGHVTQLQPENFKDSNGDHIHKGETTVNLEAINAVLRICGKDGINNFLHHYPVNDALIGKLQGSRTFALAGAIHRLGMVQVMSIVNGESIEGRINYIAGDGGASNAEPKVRGLAVVKWDGDPDKYFRDVIYNANTDADGQETHDIRVVIEKNDIVVEYLKEGEHIPVKFRFPNPQFEAVTGSDAKLGGFLVNTGAQNKMFARHLFICLNRTAGIMTSSELELEEHGITKQYVRLATIMDLMAHTIIDQLDVVKDSKTTYIAGAKRAFRKKMQETLLAYSRIPGKASSDDLEMYSSVDLLPYQAAVEMIETKSAETQGMVYERMMTVIHKGVFKHPLVPTQTHSFCVGASPKGGSGKHVTLRHIGTTRTLVEMIGQPAQHNTDRGQREAAGYATAKVLLEQRHWITTAWDHLMPELMARATTLVYAYVPGEGWLFSVDGVDNNPDACYFTDDGLAVTRYVPQHRMLGPMTEEQTVFAAMDICKDEKATLDTLVAQGWSYEVVDRDAGTLDAVDLGKRIPGANTGSDTIQCTTQWYILTSPEPLPESLGRKFGWAGHKSVGVHVPGRAYFLLPNGEKYFIDVFAANETMIQKKLEGDVMVAQVALFGHRHFTGQETPRSMETLLPTHHENGTVRNSGTPYTTTVYLEDGTPIGECVPAIHRSFVMKEDENISSSFKKNGMSASPWVTALFGGTMVLSDETTRVLQNYADYMATVAPDLTDPEPDVVETVETGLKLYVRKQALPAWWTAAFKLRQEIKHDALNCTMQTFTVNAGFEVEMIHKTKTQETYEVRKGNYNIKFNHTAAGDIVAVS